MGAAAIAAILVASLALVPFANERSRSDRGGGRSIGAIDTRSQPSMANGSVRLVRTDPTIVERWSASPPGRIIRADDGALLDALSAVGRPAGLIRTGGTVRLTAQVADVEVGATPPAPSL